MPALVPQLQPAPSPINSGGAPLPFAEPPKQLNLKPAPPKALNLGPRPLNLAPRPLNLAPPPAAAAAPAAAPAAAGAGTVAGTVAGGAVVGVTVGELGRRQLVKRGFEDLAYPSNTVEQLLDPVETIKRGVQGLAETYRDAFRPDELASQPAPVPLAKSSDPPPFEGGQSPGVLYSVTGTWTLYNADGSVNINSTFIRGVYGPIISIGPAETAPGAGFIEAYERRGIRETYFIGGTSDRRKSLVITSTNIVRADGQPDTGGNPSPAANRTPLAQSRFAPATSGTGSVAPPLPLVPLPVPAAAPEAAAPATPPPSSQLPPQLQQSKPELGFPPLPGGSAPKAPGAPQTTASPAGTPGGQSQSPSGKITRKIGNTTGTSTSTNTGTGTSTSGSGSSSPVGGPDDLCNLPCMQDLGDGMKDSNAKLDRICKLLEEIAKTVGTKEFPASLPLLTGDRAVAVKNLPELVLYAVKNLDAVSGKWPLKAEIIGTDGKTKQLKLEDFSHAYSELFAALKIVAEDADASVNALVRVAAELVQSKIAILQGNEITKSNAKFLGYRGASRARTVKLQFSPKIAGLDGQVDNYEMREFFKPSVQSYLGYECVDKRDLMGIVLRNLENGEITRAANFRPLIKDKKGKTRLTGDHIKETKKQQREKQQAAFKDFEARLKKSGAKLRVTKGVRKRNNGFDSTTR